MYRLLIIQFLRSSICQVGLVLVLTLGGISILTGKQFLDSQEAMTAQAIHSQEEHIKRNIKYHGDDLGLLLYYLKFAVINEASTLAPLSIGQSDVNPSILSVKILTLEGQKHDTDLVNPIKLLYGNLDLSFMLVYLFPLLIIAFTYNLISEEQESGTWKMVRVSARSSLAFVVSKLLVRLVVLVAVMSLLYVAASWALDIPWDERFLAFFVVGLLYQLFWFTLSFCIISLQQASNFNAIVLLSAWLVLVVLLPAIMNNAITNRYPVPEALTTIIKQRDGYHEKWDTDKRATMDAFYASYPQFESYGYPPEEGFSWLWYYAMQHLGDTESREESEAMRKKILQRQETSRQMATFIPSMNTLLAFNDLAETSLADHMHFLQYASHFHEKTRLHFYPKIFSNNVADDIDWEQFKPDRYEPADQSVGLLDRMIPLTLVIVILLVLSGVVFPIRFRS